MIFQQYLRPRTVALVTLAAFYLLLAHYTSSTPEAAPLGAFIAAAPLMGFAVFLSWHSKLRWPTLAACVLATWASIAFWPIIEQNFVWIFFLQHAGAHALLGIFFGKTLLPGRTPLCTQLSHLTFGNIPPEVTRYTKQATIAWTAFFMIMALTSTVLFFLASHEVWSVLANLLNFPLVGAMFVVEYAIRKRVLPSSHHSTILETILVFQKLRPAGKDETPAPSTPAAR